MNPLPPVKLCKDCAHYRAAKDANTDLCTHPESARGFVRDIAYFYADAMRAGICGKDARYFTPNAPRYVTRDRNELELGAGGSLIRAGD